MCPEGFAARAGACAQRRPPTSAGRTPTTCTVALGPPWNRPSWISRSASRAILADSIFQGLAISLLAGEIASLLISRMAVPVLYSMRGRWLPATGRLGKLAG